MKKYLFALVSVSALLFSSEEEKFAALKSSYEGKEWVEVLSATEGMIAAFPESVFLKEIHFFRAVAYFHQNDPDLSNRYLSSFLEIEGNSRYFEEAVKYKYFIAEKFENGFYGHLFGVAALPKLESMWETAYQLYDEVIMILPRSEMATKALFRKAAMYRTDEMFDESIDTYANLIRRFPRDALAQQAYVEIVKVYRAQLKALYLDPKCYELALSNKKKFDIEYPSSPLKIEMEEVVADIVNFFAEDVYKSALYFDKKKNPESCMMYLKTLISKYPTSKYAPLAMQKLTAYELTSDKMKKKIDHTLTLTGSI